VIYNILTTNNHCYFKNRYYTVDKNGLDMDLLRHICLWVLVFLSLLLLSGKNIIIIMSL